MKNKKYISILSINSKFAQEIFARKTEFNFRNKDLPKEYYNEKLYVFSAIDEQSIIGTLKVDKVINIYSAEERRIIKEKNISELIKRYHYAYHLYDVVKYEEKITYSEIKKLKPRSGIQKFITKIYEDEVLYDYLQEWDKEFSKVEDNKVKFKKKS